MPVIQEHPLAISALLAMAAVGIGGATAVLSQVAGIELRTKPLTPQVTWYAIRPVLSATMGLVTYLVLIAGFSLLSGDDFRLDTPQGVFLIGFLAGYLERFSQNILEGAANALDNGGPGAGPNDHQDQPVASQHEVVDSKETSAHDQNKDGVDKPSGSGADGSRSDEIEGPTPVTEKVITNG